MKKIIYMPVYDQNLTLAVSTARSILKHEPKISIYFSSEVESSQLSQLGNVMKATSKGYAGRRYFPEMFELSKILNLDYIIKLDPDAYCLKSGITAGIEQEINLHPVIGSTYPSGLSLGGVVVMRADFIRDINLYPFQHCEDTTRTRFLRESGLFVKQIKEIQCHVRNEGFKILEDNCFVHPYIKRRKFDYAGAF